MNKESTPKPKYLTEEVFEKKLNEKLKPYATKDDMYHFVGIMVEQFQDHLQKAIEGLNMRFDAMDRRFDAMDRRFDTSEEKYNQWLSNHEERIARLEDVKV